MTRIPVPLSDGRSVAYAETGAGPDVVLLHGTLTLLEDMWLALAPSLSERYRVLALDRPGHGSSIRRRLVDASPWRQAEIVREALRRIGVERPLLVGHSYGATVALCHALAYPDETAGVVALAPLCFPEMRPEQVLFGPRGVPMLGDGLARVLAAGFDPAILPLLWRAIFLPQAMPADFAEGFPFADAAGPDAMCVEGEDAVAAGPALLAASLRYGACPVPASFLGGTADLVVNNALHGLLAAQMMPKAEFGWVPGVGHMLHHFAQARVAGALAGLRRAAESRC